MYWQTRQTQELHSANSILTLRERFESPRYRAARRELSARLLEHGGEELESLEVVMFFELLGVLTHQRVLNVRLVWHAFGGWVTNYWYALRHPVDYIARGRKMFGDPLVFAEFEWLAGQVERIDRRRLGDRHAELTSPEEECRMVMTHESALPLS